MRVLFVGDVVGRVGRRILAEGLAALRPRLDPDLVIVNGENAAGGVGLTEETADEILAAGCDIVTGGNHTWDKGEVLRVLESRPRVLRPANYPPGAPGRGSTVVEARGGVPVAVVNLLGRVFMDPVDDPFRAADVLVAEAREGARVVVVDFHAEATSEKIAMGWYLDGRVSAVVGTHTHVATADERVLPGGTAYITDVGMTGPHDSVIGVEKRDVLERFLTQRPTRFTTASGDPRLSAVLVDVDAETGTALDIRRVRYPEPPDRTAP